MSPIAVQDSLLKLNQLMNGIINALPDPTFILNSKGDIIFWNEAMETFSSVKSNDVKGKHYSQIITIYLTDRKKFLASYFVDKDKIPNDIYINMDNSQAGTVYCESVVRTINKKQRHIWIKATPLYDNRKRLTAVIQSMRDITDKILQDQHRKFLEFELTRARRLEAVGTLAGGIAHDFNNFLAGILGYVELVDKDLSTTDLSFQVARSNLKKTIKVITKAQKMVDNILSFSRSHGNVEFVRTPLDVGKMIEESVLPMFKTTLPQVVLNLQNNAQGVKILAADYELERIIINLLSNAGHVVPNPGGTIDLILESGKCTRCITCTKFSNCPRCSHKNNSLRLVVADNGGGMSRDVLDKIFEPYFTTKPHGQGSGMGLTTVHGLVKSLKGQINVDSIPGSGTTVTVCFPRITDEI